MRQERKREESKRETTKEREEREKNEEGGERGLSGSTVWCPLDSTDVWDDKGYFNSLMDDKFF